MFGAKEIIDKLNTLINSGSLNSIQLAQAAGAVDSLEKNGVNSVRDLYDLPSPFKNAGRFYWVENERKYYFCNGSTWDINNILVSAPVNLYGWGGNGGDGRIGDGAATTNFSLPNPIGGGGSNWVDVAASSNGGIAIKADGTAWAWGKNQAGEVGDGTTLSRLAPVAVIGGYTDWVKVGAGSLFHFGIRADGTMWAWGSGSNGRLGDGTTVNKSSPVSVIGGFTDWIDAQTNSSYSDAVVAIRANGTAWIWGGRSSSSPVSVAGGFTDWTSGMAGEEHYIASRANGTLWTFGSNNFGQLGDGTTVAKGSPVSVAGNFTDWTSSIVAAYDHSAAIRANGTLWTWGSGDGPGKLGDGTTVNKSSPVSVVGGFADWTQVTAGRQYTLAIRANGSAWGWGSNSGKFANGIFTATSSPVSAAIGFSDWVKLSASDAHVFGLRG